VTRHVFWRLLLRWPIAAISYPCWQALGEA